MADAVDDASFVDDKVAHPLVPGRDGARQPRRAGADD
jgi:hypothetical protein